MLIKIKSYLIRYRETRFVKKSMAIFFSCFRRFFQVLPPRISFFLIAATRLLDRKISYFLASDFTTLVLKKNSLQKGERLTNLLTAFLPLQAAGTLVRLGVFGPVDDWLANTDSKLRANENFLAIAQDYFDLGEFERAVSLLKLCRAAVPKAPRLLRFKGLLALLAQEEEWALPSLRRFAEVSPYGWCPHQNIAARYPREYHPLKSDIQSGNEGLLFDAYHLLGQFVTQVGRGELSAVFYEKALEMQARLRARPPCLSPELQAWLEKEGLCFDRLRILPWEWVTQIGHLGMLEVQLRMRELGWWSGSALLLAPQGKAANKTLLNLFEKQAKIVVGGVNVSESLAMELFSLQRYRGFNFNAWKFPNGEVVAWQQAGARLLRQWEAENRPYPLRLAFDEQYAHSEQSANALRVKGEWGMKPGDWYVCLHMRDGEFYGEFQGFGQTIRNCELEPYLQAISYITSQGGWVIKMGGAQSSKLPPMTRVVDYARSKDKSEFLDLHLIRHARFFIGTTSGLTNIAMNFNIPCALVNCATPDAQLWTSQMRFAFKPIFLSRGVQVNQRQLTSTPWRWRVFNAEVLRRFDAEIQSNTADEILETVKEVYCLTSAEPSSYDRRFPRAASLLARWKASLEFPEFYGAALPSLYYLQKYEKTFLDP